MTSKAEKAAVIQQIRAAFGGNTYPGDPFLQGSYEGCEPGEEVGPFVGKEDWQALEASFLDAHAGALSFFTEAGFRFYLPAYLIADLNGELQTADPRSHLVHAFSDITVKLPVKGRVFEIKSGKTAFINPRRYGAALFFDYVRYRLSVFTREEAAAIVAYLEYLRDHDPEVIDRAPIQAALDLFWYERARSAPTAAELAQYLAEQSEYLKAITDG